MKHLKLFEEYSSSGYNFDENISLLLQNQMGHIEEYGNMMAAFLKVKGNPFYFYQKNNKGVTRFKDEKANRMGTLLSSKKEGNSVILELQRDKENVSEKIIFTLSDSPCVIPVSKYIPKGKGLESIIRIQSALKKIDGGKYAKLLGNFGPKRDGVDGQYGCGTLKAVTQFQKDNNLLKKDGIYGPDTAEVLSKKIGEHVPPHGISKREASEELQEIPIKTPKEIQKGI
jgi:hypothetical protein